MEKGKEKGRKNESEMAKPRKENRGQEQSGVERRLTFIPFSWVLGLCPSVIHSSDIF